MVMDAHTHTFYSNSCYGNINAVARVIVAMVTYILLLSYCYYADICAIAIVNYVDYLIPRKFWINVCVCIYGCYASNSYKLVYLVYILYKMIM